MAQLIIALDFHTLESANALVNQLDKDQCILKVGSEMFTLFGPSIVKKWIDQGFRVFLDLKFHDIPNTVAKACTAAAELGVWMVNLHACGGLAMMRHAVAALKPFNEKKPLLIAVTVLTALEESEFRSLGIADSVEQHALRLALLAKEAGLDGVVCSAYEVPAVKNICGDTFLTVTPGIRLDSKHDDQIRVASVEQASAWGSDYLVVGRPVTQASDPMSVVNTILNQCEKHSISS